MPNQESQKRSARTRTAVATYNLQKLTKDIRNSYRNEAKPRSTMAQHGRSASMPKAATPVSQPHKNRRSTSSGLTSPMASPSLSAVSSNLTDDAATSFETSKTIIREVITDRKRTTSRAMAPSNPVFDCFNMLNRAEGHFYSVNELFSRGVWIGYLALARHKESFRKLPSFNNLRNNFRTFSPPYPPTITGPVGEERNAVCRGCIGDESVMITLREIGFYGNQKLVIMPLDGDDEAGMFCIMLPQPNDRSLQGLHSYRLYELLNGGEGNRFNNNFMFLSLRNTKKETSLLETARAVLSPDELQCVKGHTAKRQRLDNGTDPAKDEPSSSTTIGPPYATTRRLVTHDDGDIVPGRGDKSLSTHSSRNQRSSVQDNTATSKRTHTQLNASENIPRTPATTGQSQNIHVDLTDEQARLVYIIWTVNDDGIEYEFVHTINECQSFKGFLTLIQEETEMIPAISKMLAETKVWRLTFQLPDKTKKAIVTRTGSEIAFERLQATLAQCRVWAENPGSKIEIELAALGSATAT
ncbi:hypothetical protein N0V83_000729 [Neocucurbitaria cava]|uniref:Uncharacterized protein n=1 Tax=Neocucurbitaria cava TaxID=798079 RepID=A0A9W8YHU8_9PLEO|nr:hypothetical protein N0V83_000729 [Neocucurbitaria cava]